MILMIDNYDSFTYNLVQYLRDLAADVTVHRNDTLSLDNIAQMDLEAIVISPGSGRPEDAGISCDVIRTFAGKIPLLGVCLGHQAIGLVYGASICYAKRLMHGKTSEITCDNQGLFKGLGNRPFKAMRYNSLVIDPATLPACLKVTATSEDGEIMGIRHTKHLLAGIQFHPESIMTPVGKRILRNFLKLIRSSRLSSVETEVIEKECRADVRFQQPETRTQDPETSSAATDTTLDDVRRSLIEDYA